MGRGQGGREKRRGVGGRGYGTPAIRAPFCSFLWLLASSNSWLASHAGVFRGARISSLPTNACSTQNNISFPSLANHIILSKFWKVDLDHTKHKESFMTSSKCQTKSGKSKIQSDFRILCALHNSRVMFLHYHEVMSRVQPVNTFTTVDWSLTTMGRECCSRLNRRLWAGVNRKSTHCPY